MHSLCFCLLPLFQDFFAPSKETVTGSDIVDGLMVTMVIVMVDPF